MKRIGITGSNGTIGTVLRKGLSAAGYEIVGFDRTSGSEATSIVNLERADEVVGLFDGLDAVIHLAASPSPDTPWDEVRDHNIEATYLVAEECRRAALRRWVFATTNHTQHGNSMATTPETLDPSKQLSMKLTDPPNPDSLYAISKLFGEHLGKLFSQRHGLEFVGLRIGWIVAGDDPTIMRGTKSEEYMRAMFLSHGDCVQAFRRALEVEAKFMLGYAISKNDRRVFDLTETMANLGTDPQDNAETFFQG
jgi:NAD+ dependent glucose-6-phosphate dehydrogenase